MRFGRLFLVSGVLLLVSDASHRAAAEDLAFSAAVDKTEVAVGSPLTLTLTLSGDIAGVQFPKVDLPEGLAVAAQSQATNFALRTGAMERSASLSCVIIPKRPGVFRIGPFTIRQGGRAFETEAIEITVAKPDLPPRIKPQGERFTL
jgi:uncharacterized protein (DUF58 family)